MEKEQRSKLQKATQDARRLLEEEFSRQLLETYDINVAAGRWSEEPGAHLQAEQRLLREKLLAWIEHRSVQINDEKEALLLALREMAFTALNRFVALKLMEARELVRPCVSGGLESEGFQEFTAVAQGLLVEQESSYRLYLETIFEDVSRELRALFDPRDPASLLWPKRTALLELLDVLNRPELAELWREDETLGWIYQYFNGDAERKKMREESSAPRNSRELAVRNQFFTPRYVVEFLTDNTLGRIWYEMCQGKTGLKERCRYLVRRPNEIWLQPGEEAPAEVVADEALNQEELLRQQVHIPYRPLKDPREIRMLDPACGSMHFGLYAFDLYLAIYEEAWEIAQGPDEQAKQGEAFASFVAYAADFASKAHFLREGPRLILQHNIHGVDIDPRATQIARLTLWLRAQRAWQEQGVEVAARPAISRSNVVCAEPMPGERELLADFVDQQFPEAERGLVQQLLETIFDKMQLAGEAGSLLKIEEEIRDAIDQARREWQKLAIHQRDLFSAAELAALGGVGSSLNADLQSLTKGFWIDIEERIYSALRDYASQAESGGYQRRLFAEDAAQGFAFIDICRKRYDAVVMNPPFGEITPSLKSYASRQFAISKADILCMFVERGVQLRASDCFCAAITNRTPFFTNGTEAWRETFCLGDGSTIIDLFADLGHKVLDAALVETAAYILAPSANQDKLTWFSVTQVSEKESSLLRQASSGGSFAKLNDIKLIPGKRLAYWLPSGVVSCYSSMPSLAGSVESVDKGMTTTDDFRFIRAFWEIPDAPSLSAWMYYSKGGEYSPFSSDVHLTVNWLEGGREISEVIIDKYPYLNGNSGWVLHPETHHGFTGLTYTKRTTSSFSARLLPAGARVSDKANLVYDSDVYKLLGALVCLSTSPFHYLLDAAVPSIDSSAGGTAARDYEIGTLRDVPVPAEALSKYADPGAKLFDLAQKKYGFEEATNYFTGFPLLGDIDSLSEALGAEERDRLMAQVGAIELHVIAERSLANDYGLDEAALEAIYDYMGPHPADLPHIQLSRLVEPNDAWRQTEEQLASLLIRTYGGKRRFSKQTWVGGRAIELWAFVSNHAPLELARLLLRNEDFLQRNSGDFAARVVAYFWGVACGRWDVRYAMGKRIAPRLPDPFEPLPVCPPGQLQNAQGLPARPEDVPEDYPVHIPWEGILVDDPNHHLDLERRIRVVIEIIWSGKVGGATAEAIEHEACDMLGVKTLRDYFRKPAGFFADHLKRHSKSRRQAPIYWQLSAGNGNYSAWLYYHRFTQDTLYRLLGDFVEIRIQEAEREQFELESQGGLSGDAANVLQEAQTLLQDLRLFKSELELVAPLWNPNLNDGVIINHAILWRITPYTPWQKKCKECWDKLVKGDYDWAHLAFHLWPERVIRKCTTDRSLAIAHGLEERLWQETNNGNWLQRQVSDAELQALLAEYSKPAVQNALERFLAAPPPVAAARTRAPRATKSSSTSTTRRPRGSAPEVDAETSRQTLLVLTAAPAEGLGRNGIAELLGVEAASLTAVIKQLKEGGQIEQLGAARGAKYRLSESGLAAVESQAGEID